MISSNTTTISNVGIGNIPRKLKTQTDLISNNEEDAVMTDSLSVDSHTCIKNAGLSTDNNKRANPNVVTTTNFNLIETVVKQMVKATGSQSLQFVPEEGNATLLYLQNECSSLKTTNSNGDKYSMNDLLTFVKRKKRAEFQKAKKNKAPRLYRTRPRTHRDSNSPRQRNMNQPIKQTKNHSYTDY